MDLFSEFDNQIINIINVDGTVDYIDCVISNDIANQYLMTLLNTIQWQNDEVILKHNDAKTGIINNQHITTNRLVAFYANKPLSYTYSNITKTAIPFTPLLDELKCIVEKETGECYNSCLLNLYHNGEEGMGWHSDNDPDLLSHAAIASLSFGAQRKFSFKHKHSHNVVSLPLKHGSLLVMKNQTQDYWLHALPKSKKVSDVRINLTFRTVISA